MFSYSNVNDVDLYAGGIAELPLPQANVGPTFGCIIAYQFRDLRKGDRYWFENPGQFTEGNSLFEIIAKIFVLQIFDSMYLTK